MDFLIFVLSSLGLTFIITESDLIKPIRMEVEKHSEFLGKAIRCARCMGFWSGIICFILKNLHFDIILYGLIASFLAITTYHLIEKIK